MSNTQIQWYPGHMHKARKEIIATLKKVDVCIEILDARIPYSSANPMLEELRGHKPCLKVLSKSDLADPDQNNIWRQHYESAKRTKVLVADNRKANGISCIPSMCRQLYNENNGSKTIITTMVIGIPNVGKSTLINGLAGRTVAKTGDQPAVTKVQQVIEIKTGFVLLDTPGMLWPKVENPNSGLRLAVTGAIRDTAITHEQVAAFASDYFIHNYPQRLADRYNIESLPEKSEELIYEIGRRRGCLIKGGRVDMDRASKVLLSDVRDGRLGRFTMETPEIMISELKQVEQDKQERAALKLARKKNWKKSNQYGK